MMKKQFSRGGPPKAAMAAKPVSSAGDTERRASELAFIERQLTDLRVRLDKAGTQGERDALGGQIQALETQKMALELEQVEPEIEQDFAAWLVGKGKVEDHAVTPWDRTPLMSLKAVRQYIGQFHDARWKYIRQLNRIWFKCSVNKCADASIEEIFKYYRFFIRGKLDPDNLDNIDFLRFHRELGLPDGDPMESMLDDSVFRELRGNIMKTGQAGLVEAGVVEKALREATKLESDLVRFESAFKGWKQFPDDFGPTDTYDILEKLDEDIQLLQEEGKGWTAELKHKVIQQFSAARTKTLDVKTARQKQLIDTKNDLDSVNAKLARIKMAIANMGESDFQDSNKERLIARATLEKERLEIEEAYLKKKYKNDQDKFEDQFQVKDWQDNTDYDFARFEQWLADPTESFEDIQSDDKKTRSSQKKRSLASKKKDLADMEKLRGEFVGPTDYATQSRDIALQEHQMAIQEQLNWIGDKDDNPYNEEVNDSDRLVNNTKLQLAIAKLINMKAPELSERDSGKFFAAFTKPLPVTNLMDQMAQFRDMRVMSKRRGQSIMVDAMRALRTSQFKPNDAQEEAIKNVAEYLSKNDLLEANKALEQLFSDPKWNDSADYSLKRANLRRQFMQKLANAVMRHTKAALAGIQQRYKANVSHTISELKQTWNNDDIQESATGVREALDQLEMMRSQSERYVVAWQQPLTLLQKRMTSIGLS